MKLTKQTKFLHWVAVVAIAGLSLWPEASRAEDQSELIQKLLNRIEQLEKKVNALESGRVIPATTVPPAETGTEQQLDQKVRILERQRELDAEAAAEKARSLPSFTADSSGLQVRSADSNFLFALHGVLQVDNRTFFNDGDIHGNDGFLLRRARPVLAGTVFRDFDFMFVPDFGGSTVQIFDAYLNYRYAPWLQLRAGKFKTPIGLEQLQADRDTLFNERSLVTDLVPNRDLGFQLWGDIAGGALSYAFGVFNGVGDARNSSNVDFEDHREVAGRVFVQPFKNSETASLQGLGFGVAGSFGNSSSNATALPSANGYATEGQQLFFAYNPATAGSSVVADGQHWRVSPQASYYCGPFGLLAEYVISDQVVRRIATLPLATADLHHSAWELNGSWVLTGENASFTGVTPRHSFDPRNGNWGAFQLVARSSELDIDNAAFPLFSNPAASATAAHAWSVGLNWYLNKNVLLKASYTHTTFEGGGGAGTTAPAIVTRQPEEVFFTRLQVAF